MLKKMTNVNKNKNGTFHEENQYLNLISDILQEGTLEQGRNGKVKMIFGSAMHFDLSDNKIPLLTTKRVAWKTCLRELLWFIKGDTDNKHLKEKNVKIWNDNASREFLDSRGLFDRAEDDLGPIYGFQWRHFNAKYDTCESNYEGKGVDQLAYIIDCLTNYNPQDERARRMLMTAWNPCQLDEMGLPPCHVLCQFNVTNGTKLSCSLYQRSGDIGLGVPFNIASYSILTHLLAKHCGLEAHEFIYYLGNCHIYEPHFDILSIQEQRIPFKFPTISISQRCNDIEDYDESMFTINDYKHYDPIKMEMIK